MKPDHPERLFQANDYGLLRGKRSLADAKGVSALVLLDDGRRILTSEMYGRRTGCLAFYDSDSEELAGELVLAHGETPPSAIGVVADPDRIIIDCGNHLSVVDLRNRTRVGTRLAMRFHNNGPVDGTPIPFWRYPFLGKRQPMHTASIGLFDQGRIAAVHCGVAAPSLPSHLVTWDLALHQLCAGPVRTPDANPGPRPHLTDDMAGIADVERRQFITGQRFGWVNFWDAGTLRLVRSWQIQRLPECERSAAHQADNQIHSLALSDNGSMLAVGTWTGAIHVADPQSGNEVVRPLVPRTYDYTQNATSNRPAEVSAVQFFADDKKLIAGYADGSLRVWDLVAGKELGPPLHKPGLYRSDVMKLCLIPKLSKVLSWCPYLGDSASVRVWDIKPYL